MLGGMMVPAYTALSDRSGKRQTVDFDMPGNPANLISRP